MTRQVTVNQWGASLAVRLPKDFVDRVGLTPASKVELKETNEGLLISFSKKRHITLAERFKDYDGYYSGEVIDWGDDVGGEICD